MCDLRVSLVIEMEVREQEADQLSMAIRTIWQLQPVNWMELANEDIYVSTSFSGIAHSLRISLTVL